LGCFRLRNGILRKSVKKGSQLITMNVKAYFLPINLDVCAIRANYRRAFAEKILFFVSCIHFRRVTNGDEKRDAFINLNFDILGRFIRRNDVKAVKHAAISLGIVEADRTYHVGKKSLEYRLTEKYRAERICRVPATIQKQESIYLEAMSFTESQKYIESQLANITIEEAALARLEEDSRKSVDYYNYGFISYYMIKDENWFFSTDEKTGRVFHNVANLNKELRPFLRYRGRKMVEVDISNCQPMLLHKLYPDAESAEAKRYKKIVESGKFYEVIQAITGDNREKIKLQFLASAFGKPEHVNKVRKAFDLLFPELGALMNEFKAEAHNRLAIAMQRLEANLIVNAVVPRCAGECILALTVHDSIMTLPEHRNQVAEMIRMECERIYGLTPNLKLSEN